MLLKRSMRFAVAVDGTVTVRRRPLVTACQLLGDVLGRFDGVLDEVAAYMRTARTVAGASMAAGAAAAGSRRAVTATTPARS